MQSRNQYQFNVIGLRLLHELTKGRAPITFTIAPALVDKLDAAAAALAKAGGSVRLRIAPDPAPLRAGARPYELPNQSDAASAARAGEDQLSNSLMGCSIELSRAKVRESASGAT